MHLQSSELSYLIGTQGFASMVGPDSPIRVITSKSVVSWWDGPAVMSPLNA